MDKIKYVLNDNIGSVEFIEHMGSDLSIVNDARISFNSESKELTPKDEKLIKYLIEHDHTSPLRSSVLKFKVKAPLYITRQIYKHTVASSFVDEQKSWNEQSLRYTEITPEFYIPQWFYKQDKISKQCSSVELCEDQDMTRRKYKASVEYAYNTYKDLLKMGVSKETARGVLPTCTYTTFVWTISLQALILFLKLRKASNAQSEIRAYANALQEFLKQTHPFVHKYYFENENDN